MSIPVRLLSTPVKPLSRPVRIVSAPRFSIPVKHLSIPVRPFSTPVRPFSTPVRLYTSQTFLYTSQTFVYTSRNCFRTCQTFLYTSQTFLYIRQAFSPPPQSNCYLCMPDQSTAAAIRTKDTNQPGPCDDSGQQPLAMTTCRTIAAIRLSSLVNGGPGNGNHFRGLNRFANPFRCLQIQ